MCSLFNTVLYPSYIRQRMSHGITILQLVSRSAHPKGSTRFFFKKHEFNKDKAENGLNLRNKSKKKCFLIFSKKKKLFL